MSWTHAEPRGRVRGWLRGDSPPSLAAQLAMAAAMLLCGGVLAGLVFVGFWGQKATDATRARTAQLDDQARLRAAARTLAALREELAQARTVLAGAAHRNESLTTALAAERAAKDAIAHADATRLRALGDGAAALARQASALQSEVSALQTYAVAPGAAGLDTAYLANQTRYLATSAAGAAAAAAKLAADARAATASLARAAG